MKKVVIGDVVFSIFFSLFIFCLESQFTSRRGGWAGGRGRLENQFMPENLGGGLENKFTALYTGKGRGSW